MTIPASTVGPTWCSRNPNRTTTPKLPPPPRSAHNSSGSVDAFTVTGRPSAVTRFGCSGQAAPAHKVAEPAAESEPADPGMADDPTGHGEAVRLRPAVDVAPQCAALHVRHPAVRLDPDRPHQGQVHHDPVLA